VQRELYFGCLIIIYMMTFIFFVAGGAMINLANAYFVLGRHQDALPMMEQALEIQQRGLPENHINVGISCFNLCNYYHRAGHFDRALRMARKAMRIIQATLPPSHPLVYQAQELVRRCESDAARRV
jgi:tetratricopeptide (TPR) repeat protein